MIALAVAGSTAFEQVNGQQVAFASMTNYDVAEVNASGDVVDFLLSATDTRLISIEEATVALNNGSSEKIRDFARKMVIDQTKILGYIKKLSLMRGLELPDHVNEEIQTSCDKLAGMSGDKFDKEFVNLIIKDRKRDLELFRKATYSSDPEIREFAELCIPVLEEQLKNARELKK